MGDDEKTPEQIEQETISAILTAPDVACAETFEDITEPVALQRGLHLTRVTRQDYSSATVNPGKIVRHDIAYVNPANHPGWGGRGNTTVSLV